MSTHLDKNNIILSGELEGSFYPSTQQEILRNVVIKSPLHLKGGLFAQNISNQGGCIITGPVLATKEITLEHPGKDSMLRFLSGLNATLTISVNESGKGIEESVVSDSSKADIFIRGDVVSDMVKLDNALVFGNVRARQALIVNSVIIGSLLVEEELIISGSNFISFSAGKVILKGRNSCWLPYGTSLNPIEFKDEDLGNGNFLYSELRYLALCRTETLGCGFNKGSISCSPYIRGECAESSVRLGPSDIRSHKTKSGDTIYALNIAQRALNLAPVEKEIKQVENFLKEILMYEHLDIQSQKNAISELNKKLKADEKHLLEKIISLNDT